MIKKWIAVLLLVCLPFSALGEVKKEEVVYAKLGLDGQIKDVYVINAFESDGEETIADYGAYTARISLTDERNLPQTGDEISLSLKSGRYYYQGNGLDKPLPWTLSLTASLDGQPLAPAMLGGASGEIALMLSIGVNPDAAPLSGYTLQITVTLDGDLCRNIQAPGGTIALAGGDRQITYALLPGMEAEYAITFQAENFRMNGIQVGGVRMNMDANMYAEMFTSTMGEPMATMVRGIAQNAISSMAGGDLISFADERNAVSQVQFVLLTDSIERPLTVSAPATSSEESMNFWQRLLQLFTL